MLEHHVFIKVNDESKVEEAVKAIMAMEPEIPEILEISAGRNFSNRSQGFQLGLRVKLADRDALEGYQNHPVHLKLIETVIAPLKVDAVAMDYEY